MPQITDLIQSGGQHVWLAIPVAVVLGALHGLEPGHAKTMMAGFIVAIRGTAAQAGLLAIAATISHTAVVWIVVLAGLALGARLDAEASEPYFLLASSALIIAIALWMIGRAYLSARRHDRSHHSHDGHEGHTADHGRHEPQRQLAEASAGARDAHELFHARQIRERFAERDVTTGQIILFGLTGGLVPCAAAVTVLLLCLQLNEFYLGVLVVLAFSVGLALTLIASGIAAALGVRGAQRRWSGFDAAFRRAPFISGAVVLCIGLFTAYSAWTALL